MFAQTAVCVLFVCLIPLTYVVGYSCERGCSRTHTYLLGVVGRVRTCAHAPVIEEMSIFIVEQKELSISQKKDTVETA